MRRTEGLQEVRQMRFEAIDERFRCGRLSSADGAAPTETPPPMAVPEVETPLAAPVRFTIADS
jgi:hypothetical protein